CRPPPPPPRPPRPPPPPPPPICEQKDPIKTKETKYFGLDGMLVDRVSYYEKAKEELQQNQTIKENKEDLIFIKNYLEKEIFDKPELYMNWELLRQGVTNLDYRATPFDLLEHYLFNKSLPTKQELLQKTFNDFCIANNLNTENIEQLREFFTLYIADQEFKTVIDNKRFVELDERQDFDMVKYGNISPHTEKTVNYIKDNVNIEKFNWRSKND
ncbi:MAG: hypothetical protein LBH46_03250, partial [Rickettsiales bacterium]|nr:hypothetical protein [Rickettsiales bacterium]